MLPLLSKYENRTLHEITVNGQGYFNPFPSVVRFLARVAIIHWNKKSGGPCGTKEKVGGPTQMFILHGDFPLF